MTIIYINGYAIKFVTGTCSECEEANVECRVQSYGLVCEPCIVEPLGV